MEIKKDHWIRLIKLIQREKNGKCSFDFQDGLPIRVERIQSENRNIDLTKSADLEG